MALDASVFASSKTTLVVKDYNGSPNSLTISTLIGDVVIPAEVPRDKVDVMVNGSTGKSLYAEPVNGDLAPPTGSFQFAAVDISDNSEVTAPVSLLLALSVSSVSGTAYSGWTFTSGLTGKGSLQAKFEFTVVNEAGVSHVLTLPVVVTSLVDGHSGGVRVWTCNYKLVGPVTRA